MREQVCDRLQFVNKEQKKRVIFFDNPIVHSLV